MATEIKVPTRGRALTGKVISTKMDKTVVVEVSRTIQHTRYHKYIRRTATYKAHDEDNLCEHNQLVTIRECRPISKSKRWIVVRSDGGES